jgi:hypothetical protein
VADVIPPLVSMSNEIAIAGIGTPQIPYIRIQVKHTLVKLQIINQIEEQNFRP